MEYKIILSSKADKNLEEILIFIGKDNNLIANYFVEGLLNSIDKRLRHFPYIGRLYKGNKRILVYKKYAIFYSVDENHKFINIITILNPSKYSGYKNLK